MLKPSLGQEIILRVGWCCCGGDVPALKPTVCKYVCVQGGGGGGGIYV